MHPLWDELGTTMRALREAAGRSLRQVEAGVGIGRGTISQVERGQARPTRELVEWYDAHLGGDGLLMTMYAEVRGAHRGPQRPEERAHVLDGDGWTVSDPLLATGQLVTTGSTVTAGWTLVNAGPHPWFGRTLRRVGAHAAPRLLGSPPATKLLDCYPGEMLDVRIELDVPELPGTLAAYWQLVDDAGHACLPPSELLAVVVTARAR